jgi:RNA polymerase sigma-70 factor (ECF subfamily)
VTYEAAEVIERGGEDLESVFRAEYPGVARLIGSIVRDPGRAEELAVEVFLRWGKRSGPGSAGAWLRRVAVRLALDELRKRKRWERVSGLFGKNRTEGAAERRFAVTRTLEALKKRDVELLVLRTEGLSYEELAQVLGLNLASVGTLLARARKSFEEEYRRHDPE